MQGKSAISDRPSEPQEALSAEELQRFIHSCAREKRSPTTLRAVDAASYAWIHRFIHAYEVDPDHSHPEDSWLAPTEAHPDSLAGFFTRVGQRTRDGPARGYANQLADYFKNLDERLYGWPGQA